MCGNEWEGVKKNGKEKERIERSRKK